MSDDKQQRGPEDGQRVNVHENYEVRYWANKFGVTTEELRQAVERVGPMATAVERHLWRPQ